MEKSESKACRSSGRRALYGMNDAMGVLELFRSYQYNEKVELEDGFTIRFTDVGHLLGPLPLKPGSEKKTAPGKLFSQAISATRTSR